MAYGAIASGLIGAASAAGNDAEQRMKLANEEASKSRMMEQEVGIKKRLIDMELEAKMDFQTRVDEMKRAGNMKAGAKISNAQQGIINARTESMASGYDQSNPAAAAFIRNERGANELEKAQAGNEASSSLGYLDRQKEFGDQIKDINTKDATDKRYAIESKKNDERDTETVRHNKATEEIQRIAKADKSAGTEKDTARIKNANYLLDNKIVSTPAEAWEKSSELGGKNAEDVLLSTAQKIKSDADKNFHDMTFDEAVQQAKDLMSAVKGKTPAAAPKKDRKPLSTFGR